MTSDALTVLERFNDKWLPEPNSGCHLWTASVCSGGYGTFRIGGRKGRVFGAHRISWELRNGSIPDGMCVLHRCDTPSCINPEHLFLGTKQDNSDDCKRKGRTDTARGESNGMAKLNASRVREIRQNADGLTQKALAARYGIHQSTVSDIMLRTIWAHVV